jgi:hypothetical protein
LLRFLSGNPASRLVGAFYSFYAYNNFIDFTPVNIQFSGIDITWSLVTPWVSGSRRQEPAAVSQIFFL